MNRFPLHRPLKVYWLAFIVSCCLLVSCSSNEFDTSYLGGTACAAPCWHNITPGVTDETTAIDIIQHLEFIDSDNVRLDKAMGTAHLYIFDSFGGGMLRVWSQDNLIRRIELSPDSDIPLAKMIEVFGEPDFVIARDSGEEYYCFGATLYYLKGIVVRAFDCVNEADDIGDKYGPGNTIKVYPDMLVDGLEFFEGDTDLKTVLLRALYFPSQAADVTTEAEEWIGYGYYQNQ